MGNPLLGSSWETNAVQTGQSGGSDAAFPQEPAAA